MLQADSVAAAAAEPPLGVGLPRLGEPESEDLNSCGAAPLARTPQLITLAVTFLAGPELTSQTSDRGPKGTAAPGTDGKAEGSSSEASQSLSLAPRPSPPAPRSTASMC